MQQVSMHAEAQVLIHTAPPVVNPADIAACRAMLREGSKTFFAASLLLPAAVREPASALYAFCRLADDAVDMEEGGSARQLAAIGRLRQRLAHAYDGRPGSVAADRALAQVVHKFSVPRALPEALIEGFEWDAQGRGYETMEELRAYAARVAGAVGAMMSLLMQARSASAVARACDLGVAMQLSNIARDVGEDARMGRLYLPREWMREAGLDPDAWLRNPAPGPALASVISRVLAEASRLYAQVGAGVAELPRGCRPGINAARFLYQEIGREVARANHDSVSRRAVVPAARKAWLLTRALVEASVTPGKLEAPPLPETTFLVTAAVNAPMPPRAADTSLPWWDIEARVAWLIDLFERLERQDREAAASRARMT
jgi:phytoene synthase